MIIDIIFKIFIWLASFILSEFVSLFVIMFFMELNRKRKKNIDIQPEYYYENMFRIILALYIISTLINGSLLFILFFM